MSFNRDFFSDRLNPNSDSSSSDLFRDLNEFRRSRRPEMMFTDNPMYSMGFGSRPSYINGFRDGRFGGTGLPTEIPIVHERGDNLKASSQEPEVDNQDAPLNSSSSSVNSDQTESKHEAKIQPRVHHIPIKVEPRDEMSNNIPLSRSSSGASQRSGNSIGSGHSIHRSESPFSSSPHRKLSPSPSKISTSSDEHIIPITVEKGVEPVRKQTRNSSLPKNVVHSKSASPSPGLSQSTRRTPTPQKETSNNCGPYVTRIAVQEETSAVPPEANRAQFDPIVKISEINKEIASLEAQINTFTGEHQDKQYRYLDEMLTRCMLKLDSIEVEGREDVRLARKASLNTIDKCLNILDAKAAQNTAVTSSDEKMETNVSAATSSVESDEQSKSTAVTSSDQKMETINEEAKAAEVNTQKNTSAFEVTQPIVNNIEEPSSSNSNTGQELSKEESSSVGQQRDSSTTYETHV